MWAAEVVTLGSVRQIVTDPLSWPSGVVLLLLLLLHGVVATEHLGELVGPSHDRRRVQPSGLA